MKISTLHKIIALILVVLLCLNNLKTIITVSDFIYRQAEIAKNLCIQKDNQQGCNGKCQLKIALTESNSEPNPYNIPAVNRTKLDVFQSSKVIQIKLENTEMTDANLIKTVLKPFVLISSTVEVDTPPPKHFI
jgi:hypothetical protein